MELLITTKTSSRPPHPTLSPQAGRGSGTPCEHHLVFGDAVVLSLSPFFTGRGWGEGRAHMIRNMETLV